MRVPFIAWVPGSAMSGRRVTPLASGVDIMPTIASLLNAPQAFSSAIDGIDLSPVIFGQESDPHRALFWHYPRYGNQGGFPGGAIRIGDWKLIERYEDGKVHLYNLQEDPSERRDQADAEIDRVAELRGALHRWYEQVGARFLRPRSASDAGPAASPAC